MTLDEIKSLINNDEYEVLSERTIKTDKAQRREIELKHKKCNNTYFLQLTRVTKHFQECPFCNPKKNKITDKIFKEKVYSLVGDEYSVLSDYENAQQKIKFKHNKCGTVFEMKASHFLNDGNRCKKCSMQERYNKEFKNDLKIMSDDKIIMNEEYKGAHTNIEFLCKNKNHIFITSPSTLYGQYRKCGEMHCTICDSESNGEKLIKQILDKYNISYEYNKSINGLISNKNKPLRFDFIINNNICIEFDGRQHYDINSKYYNESQIENDNLKNIFCEENNIPLLRIKSYSKLQIEKEIIKFLKSNNVLS